MRGRRQSLCECCPLHACSNCALPRSPPPISRRYLARKWQAKEKHQLKQEKKAAHDAEASDKGGGGSAESDETFEDEEPSKSIDEIKDIFSKSVDLKVKSCPHRALYPPPRVLSLRIALLTAPTPPLPLFPPALTQIPMQDNCCDCGVFVIQYVWMFCRLWMMYDDIKPIIKNNHKDCFSMRDIKRQRKTLRRWIMHRVEADKTAAEPPKLSEKTMLYSGGGCYRAQTVSLSSAEEA